MSAGGSQAPIHNKPGGGGVKSLTTITDNVKKFSHNGHMVLSRGRSGILILVVSAIQCTCCDWDPMNFQLHAYYGFSAILT